MKKALSILLSVLLCIIGIQAVVFAEGTKQGIVSLGSVTGAVGETVSVPVSIQNNPGIISIVTDISYDSAALKLISVTQDKSVWSDAAMTPGGDLTAQPFRIIWYEGLAKTDFTADGTLAALSFEILKAGTHTVSVSVSAGDTFGVNFDPVSFTVKNGTVGTQSASAAPETTTAPAATLLTVTSASTLKTTSAATATTVSSMAAAAGSGVLSLGKVSGAVGDTVSVPVSIQNNPGIISLVADISYDPAALRLKAVKQDTGFWKTADMTPGGDLAAQPFRIIWYEGLAKTDFTADGTLAALSFEILKAGTHTVSVSVSADDTFDVNFNPVSYTVKSGTVETVAETAVQETTVTSSTVTAQTTVSATVTSTSQTQSSVTAAVTTETATSVPESLRGDVNSDGGIGVEDAQLALVAYVNHMSGQAHGLTDAQFRAADVNQDGELSVDDAQN
ncbi:MAG: hypothetical protein IJM46_11565, partial [Oscillospiraceae bacterium]|nr:hypothetical protein [Oscillospiraceae bacterium]